MSFPYYQSAGEGWGTSQYRFGPPPAPSFQPQPHWGGWDFFRSHAHNPDRAIFESALDRVKNYEGAAGVGIYEARRFHRMVYGGLVDITTAPASEIGHAAAYEAFRMWRHHGFICSPLGGDMGRQRECMMGLAVAEATRICNYAGRIVDRIGCQVAADSAASTASLIFSQTEMAVADQEGTGPAEGNQMNGMNMGGGMAGMNQMGGMSMGPGMRVGMGGMQGQGPTAGQGMGMNPMIANQAGMGGMGPMGDMSGMGGVGQMGGGISPSYGGGAIGGVGGSGLRGGAQSPFIYDDRYAYTGTPVGVFRGRALSAPGSPVLSGAVGTSYPGSRGATPFRTAPGSPFAGAGNAAVNELANGMAVGGGMANGMGPGMGPGVGGFGAYGPAAGIGGARSMPGSPYLGPTAVTGGVGVNPMQIGQPMVGGVYPNQVYVQQPGVMGGAQAFPGGGGGYGGTVPGYVAQPGGYPGYSGNAGRAGGMYSSQAGYGYPGGQAYQMQPGSTVNIIAGSGRKHRRSRRHSTAGYI